MVGGEKPRAKYAESPELGEHHLWHNLEKKSANGKLNVPN
jgi:hypothetical protein